MNYGGLLYKSLNNSFKVQYEYVLLYKKCNVFQNKKYLSKMCPVTSFNVTDSSRLQRELKYRTLYNIFSGRATYYHCLMPTQMTYGLLE